ncbi:MAG: cupredoxin domain-containing protein [Anaerolineae bacterium]
MFSKKFMVLVLMLVAVAALAVACGGGSSSSGSSTVDVTITGTDFKFDPATINAKAGQTVNVTFVNKGQSAHTFVVKDANVNIRADVGQTTKVTFTAPAKAGTYPITCDVPGHADQGMTGSLVVQ